MSTPRLYVIATLSNEKELGIDCYAPSRRKVCCAAQVLRLLRKPAGDPTDFATKWALSRYENAREFLLFLEDAMVEVSPSGAVVGEYSIQPFFIRKKTYDAMKEMKLG